MKEWLSLADDPDKVVGNFAAIDVDAEAGRERITTVFGDETGDPRRIDIGWTVGAKSSGCAADHLGELG